MIEWTDCSRSPESAPRNALKPGFDRDWLREATGSFVAAFLLIPVILLIMAAIIWFYSPEHARKDLDEIAV
jgi:hypothetical protein